MAHTALDDRLEHLVSYSSQLVFIGGSNRGAQNRLLDSFLHQQQSDTEIAYLTATKDKSPGDYRLDISKQLLSSPPTFIQRPLNELLAPLNAHQGRILVAIYAAEQLSLRFIQELWQWVLQSRFAKNTAQISVLLLGSNQWAQATRAALPSQGNHKALLLCADQMSEAPHPPSTELEQFIQQKRAAFAQRKQQQHQCQSSGSVIQKPAFKILVGVILVLCFAASLYGFYPQVTKAQHEQPLPQPTAKAQQLKVEQVKIQQIKVQQIKAPPEPATQVTLDASSTAKDELVTSWPKAVEQLKQKSVAKKRSQTVADKPKAAVVAAPIPATSVEPTTQSAEASQLQANPFKFDEALLLQQQGFALQLAGMHKLETLSAFLRDNQLHDKVWVYQTLRNQQPWYVILHKGTFSSIQQGRQSPVATLIKGAFVKRFEQIKTEIDHGYRPITQG